MTSRRKKAKPSKKTSWSALARERLATYGLTVADAKQLGIEELSAKCTAQLLSTMRSPPELPSLLFRYHDVHGTQREGVWRLRLLELPTGSFGERKQLGKYLQEPGTPPVIYWPRTRAWSKLITHPSETILITEGEGKAACAAKHGYACLGLGGVWSWRSKRHDWSILPELLEVTWAGREVIVVFDSDGRRNEQVCLAAAQLTRQLQHRGARTKVVFLPDLDGHDKVGLDDFIVLRGPEAFDALLEDGEEYEVSLPKRLTVADLGAILRYDAWDAQPTHWSGALEYNECTQELCLGRRPYKLDDLITELRAELAGKGAHAAKEDIADVALHLARDQGYHPVREYLLELGPPPRGAWLERLVTQAFRLEQDELSVTLIRKFAISAVARALDPGCKVDTALILVGPQGWRKSSFFGALFGSDYLGDTVIDLRQIKDSILALHRCWCYEWQEMHTYRRADIENIKGFITSRADIVRLPYERSPIRKPRWTVVVGSTNDDAFLTDQTGSRRFWPVPVPYPIDLDWVETHRDAVWAEAVEAYQAGEPWWLDEGSREARQLWHRHEQHEVVDIVEERIRLYLQRRAENGIEEPPSVLDVIDGAGLSERVTSSRIGLAMKRCGYRGIRPKVAKGKPGPTLYVPEAWQGQVRDLKGRALEELQKQRAKKKKF
jgi:hypothetical protein